MSMNEQPPRESSSPVKRRFGRSGWLAAGVLGALFAVAVWFAFRGWTSVPNEMNTGGYAIMVIGLIFLALLGGGLMALMFWSHKKGFDR